MNRRLLRLALFAAVALVPLSMGAQESSPSPLTSATFHSAPLSSAPFALAPAAGSLAQALGCLFLLVALFGAGIYLVKNSNLFFRPGVKGPKKLVISETRMLGNRQFLVVAEYDDRKMLIGVCPGRIDYLCPLGARDDTFSTVLPDKPE